jgi:hypothetical protein
VKRALVALLLVAASLAGCGIPTRTRPIVVGDAPREDGRSDNGTGQPAGPDGARTAQELVDRFLKASAGANEGTADRTKPVDEAVNRLHDFLTPDAGSRWQPGSAAALKVVQAAVSPAVRTSTPDVDRVDVRMRPVGTLNAQGEIEPAADTTPYTVSFTVRPAGGPGSGYRIAEPPPNEVLLSSAGLTELYEARSIYFWDRSDRYLVPDLRYMAKLTPVDQRPNELVDWLRRGSSDWLAPAVNQIPEPIQVKDRVSAPGQAQSRLQVNLSSKANGAQEQVQRFYQQLQWTLTPDTGAVDLRIEGQKVPDLSDSDYLMSNPAYLPPGKEPDAFCVVGGQIRPAAPADNDAPPPILGSDQNSGVVRAAITREQALALVKTEGAGQQRLWLGSWDDNQNERAGAEVDSTDLVAHTLGRPAWLARTGSRLLVIGDGRLYTVQQAGRTSSVSRVGGLDTATAFAVAPDGRRLAYVSKGHVYVAPLLSDDGVTVGPSQEVLLGLSDLTDPTALAWDREEALVVAGRINNRTALASVTVDSAAVQVLQLSNAGELAVNDLEAHPVVSREGTNRPARVLVEANGRAWEVYSGSVGTLEAAGPNPSPGPGAAPVTSAPFFVD